MKTKALFFETTWSCFPKGHYPRNKQLLDKLRADYDKVDTIKIPAPKGTFNMGIVMFRLAFKILPKSFKHYDIVLIGYNNLFFDDILFKYMTFSNLYVSDFLFSKWYASVKDYKYDVKPIVKRAMWLTDKSKINKSDFLIFDTKKHIKMLTKYFPEIEYKNTILEYVHTDYELFNPKSISKNHVQFKNRVFFHGNYIPLQGTPIITKAISELKNIEVIMVGKGHDYSKALKNYNPIKDNTMFIDHVPYEQLPFSIHEAEVCLGGPFGSSEKAKAVITNKTFEYLAMNKKTIVGDTPANKELLKLFPKKKHLIYFCKINDHVALKNTILKALNK